MEKKGREYRSTQYNRKNACTYSELEKDKRRRREGTKRTGRRERNSGKY